MDKYEKLLVRILSGISDANIHFADLCSLLKKNNFQIFLETSGSQPFSGDWDWICLSPKINFPPLPAIYNKAHELKVIIRDSKDFEWAEKNASLVGTNCLLYLQPEWSRRKEVIPLIVEYISKNPKWLVSLQSHKYMNIP